MVVPRMNGERNVERDGKKTGNDQSEPVDRKGERQLVLGWTGLPYLRRLLVG